MFEYRMYAMVSTTPVSRAMNMAFEMFFIARDFEEALKTCYEIAQGLPQGSIWQLIELEGYE